MAPPAAKPAKPSGLRLAGMAALWLACSDPEAPPRPVPGSIAAREPVGLDGAALDPLAAVETPVTVLVFVDSDCPISNRYAPTLAELHRRYAGRGVGFYVVYPDPGDTATQIEAHVRAFSLPGIPVHDPGHHLVAAAQVRVTPEVAVFRAAGERQSLAYHGRIDDRARDFGNFRADATQHDLAAALDAVLAGRDPVPPATPAIGCTIADLS